MLGGILFLALILVVAVLITVDVVRSPTETAAGPVQGPGPERVMAGAHSGTAVAAFPREPAGLDKAVPPPVVGARFEPGPARVDSVDRPNEVPRAFDPMHREMTRSVASEAELREKLNAIFVNLSRRSQSLVERQLRLIDALEHGEQDPQRRANLSKLNRVAMRMHRNSQNLLVMAGHQPSSGWNQPVTLAHLVNAAVAEVEDYERVLSDVQPDIAVRGPAVNDLVHLLVELIENATSFSAAEMVVQIKGQILTSGGALVDITDRGIGMTAKEMAYANQQLDHPPAADADVPRWMGLLVVARLAARHGIRVRLNQAESGGLTALVWLPDEILTHYAVPPAPARAAAEQRSAPVSAAPLASVRTSMPDMLAAQPDPAWSARGAQATLQAEPSAAAWLSRSGAPDALNGDAGVAMPQVDSQALTHGPPIYDEVESHWFRGGRDATGSSGPVTAAGPVTAPAPVKAGGPATAPSPVTAPAPITAAGSVAARGPLAAPGPAVTPGPVTASGPAAAPGAAANPGPVTASGPSAPPVPAAASSPAAAPGSVVTPGPAAPALPKRPPTTTDPRAGLGPLPGAPNRPRTPGRDPRTGRQRGGSPGWAGPADEANPGPDES